LRKRIIPADWLPPAKMDKVIVHWTAGGNKANGTDLKHYHILIEGDGKLVKGTPSIKLNQKPLSTGYAAHTLNCNTGAIAVSLCGMVGAVESPFNPGKSPITQAQWDILPKVLADLSQAYDIPVARETMLSHAEVQDTLGIKQKGKWDISVLPFNLKIKGAKAVGDAFRSATKAELLRQPEVVIADPYPAPKRSLLSLLISFIVSLFTRLKK
jgi:hypothetical protein